MSDTVDILLRKRQQDAAIEAYNVLNGQDKAIFTQHAIEELLRPRKRRKRGTETNICESQKLVSKMPFIP